MVKSIFDQADEVDIKHAIQLLLHRLRHPTIADQAVRDGVHLLACIIDRTRAVPFINSSNVVLFCLNSDVFKSISTRSLPGKIREGSYAWNEPQTLHILMSFQVSMNCYRRVSTNQKTSASYSRNSLAIGFCFCAIPWITCLRISVQQPLCGSNT